MPARMLQILHSLLVAGLTLVVVRHPSVPSVHMAADLAASVSVHSPHESTSHSHADRNLHGACA